MRSQLPVPPELELLLEELELELDEEELLDELELLLELELPELEDELELEELLLEDELELVPLQLAACGSLPVISRLSIFPRPLLLVACKRMRWLPALKLMLVDAVLQVAHAPVPGKLTAEPAALPFTSGCAVRFVLEPFA